MSERTIYELSLSLLAPLLLELGEIQIHDRDKLNYFYNSNDIKSFLAHMKNLGCELDSFEFTEGENKDLIKVTVELSKRNTI